MKTTTTMKEHIYLFFMFLVKGNFTRFGTTFVAAVVDFGMPIYKEQFSLFIVSTKQLLYTL